MKSSSATTTGAEIKKRLGIADRTLARWLNEMGLKCKRDREGRNPKVELWDLVEWLYSRDPVGEESEISSSAALERYRLAKAEEAERKNAIETGKLRKVEEEDADRLAILRSIRSALEPIARSNPSVEKEIVTALDAAASAFEELRKA